MDLISKDEFLGDFFDEFLPTKKASGMKCDIYEENNDYHIVLDIPEVKKEDIKIEIDNGYLTISVSKKEETEDEGKNYIRRERHRESYKRNFYVGNMSSDLIEAKLKNGVLEVVLPKEAKEETKKSIDIK